MSTQTNIIITIIILAALGIGGYLLFFNGNTTALSASNTAPASAAEQTFLNLTSQAQSISFDTSILSDPRFTSLIDTRTAIVPVTEGRSDPFSPIAGLSGN